MNVDRLNQALRRVPAWPLYPLGLLPAVWLWFLGFTGGLGVEPIRALEQELGKVGLQFLIVGLLVSPLRRFISLNLVRYRRAIGLLAFFYIVQHLLVWLVLDVGNLGLIWADILKRPYITVGMLGFAVMVPLALTSNDWAVRKLGAQRWRKLHLLTYAVAIVGVGHYILLVKGWPLEPILYALVVAAVLVLRLIPRRRTLQAG